jgi:agmatine/peptidylarginine deiminase
MSTEFIIGTVITAIGTVATIIGVVTPTKKNGAKKVGHLPVDGEAKQLIANLVHEGNINMQRQILQKIAKILSSEFHETIKEDYINNFQVNGRGKERIVEDILFSNGIFPSDELCLALLGCKMPSFQERFNMQFNPRPINMDEEPNKSVSPKSGLITPKDANTVYLSELLKIRFPETCNRLITILDRHNIPHKFIKATKDIWCRDYMPVQVGKDKFVQFRYDPSYLKGEKEWEDSRTDTKEVCRVNGIKPVFSDINLDGGNLLRCSDKAIISDRVFTENPEYTDKTKLLEEIKKLLEVNEIIVILSQNSDLTGHADGMVRFVNNDTILGNDRELEYKYWREGINKVIEKHKLKYIDVPFFEDNHPNSAIGIYVNYLEIKDLIVLPIFEVPGNKDNEVVRLFKKIFSDRKIETINCNDVALQGGLLNCTTWTVFE